MTQSILKILLPALLAVFCFAVPVGTFDDESSIGETQKAMFNSTYGEYANPEPEISAEQPTDFTMSGRR